MGLDTLKDEDKGLAKLANRTELEECPKCGERAVIRCGTVTRCYSDYCSDPDPFDPDY